MPARLEVLSNLADGLMQLAQHLAVGRSVRSDRLRAILARYEPEHAAQEAVHAFDPGVVPIEIFLRRRGEERKQASRVGAVLIDDGLRIDYISLVLGHFGAFTDDHALREQALHRFAVLDQPQIPHDLSEKAGIDQMQNGVLDAADVLVDRKPVTDLPGIEGPLAVVWVAIAVEIPRRIDEGIHGIRFAFRGASAAGALHLQKLGHGAQGRASHARDLYI